MRKEIFVSTDSLLSGGENLREMEFWGGIRCSTQQGWFNLLLKHPGEQTPSQTGGVGRQVIAFGKALKEECLACSLPFEIPH